MAIFWALFCGFSFGLGDTLTRLGVRSGTPFTGAVIISFTISLAFLFPAFGRLTGAELRWPAMAWFLLTGIAATGPGRILYYFSVRRIGVSRASILASFTPLAGMLIAVVFLGERPSAYVVIGAFLVVGGILGVITDRSGVRILPLAALLGLLPTLFFSLTPVFIRLGMQSLPDAILGTFVSSLGALAFVLSVQKVIPPGDRWSADRRAFLLFLGSGVCYTSAFFAFYKALGMETVSFVVPLVYTSPFFSISISRILFQHLERISWRLVAGAVAVFLGVVFVTLSRGG
ncbi:MAG: DMT family transporter [Nitrospinota bacterium]